MKTTLSWVLLCFTVPAFAQVKAPLKKVTVYPGGAVMEHSVQMNLKKGSQTLILRGLATSVDPSSIQVEIDGYVNLLSQKYLLDYKKQAVKADAVVERKVSGMEKKIAAYNKEINSMQQKMAIERKSLELISVTPKTTLENSNQVTALSGYVALYREQAYKSNAKITEYTEREAVLRDSISILEERIQKINEDLEHKAENDSLKHTACIELQLNAPLDVFSKINITYFSNRANWNPSYDVLSEGLDKQLKVKYKANINQTTGIDWNNVKVSVSTSQPNRSNAQPMLSAWYLDVYKGYTRSSEGFYNSIATNTVPTITNEIPSFGLDSPIDIAVVDYGGLSISFDSDMQYSIPTDNKPYMVMLKTFNVDCEYKYYTVPKLDKDVFLLAEITNFEQFNFLPGEAQIFMDGKFTGKTLIDPFTTAEAINVSLGRDNNILVKRERDKATTKSKFLDNDKVDHYKYSITVKNNRQQDIQLIIKDQYPMTSNDKIKIIETDHSAGGTINDKNGVVTWIEKLNKGKSTTVSIEYKVSRPKDMVIAGL